MRRYEPIPVEEIRKARERIKDTAIKTPLLRLNLENAPAEIYLKLETLQPIGSFKIRGAANALKKAEPSELKHGVWTMSAGNHGQGVAYTARKHGIKCIINVPPYAAKTKIDALKRMGADIITRKTGNLEELRAFFDPETYSEMEGLLIHPFSDPNVMAGQGTIGLEIIEDLPDVDAVVTPWGGGGLSCGVASAIRAVKPDVKLYACEPETGNALASSFREGKRVEVEYRSTFVESAGAPFLYPEMWDLGKRLLDGSIVTSVEKTASAIRLLAERNKIISEGAGALPVAAALEGKAGSGKVVCVVSGASIDLDEFAMILQGKTPEPN
jgi:threonine dehydratase